MKQELKPNYINGDEESSSDKEQNYQYDPQAPNSVTLSTISQSSCKGLPKIGDEARFSQMSLHKIYSNSTHFGNNGRGAGIEYPCAKIKFLIPFLPSYLVSPFPK